jgi:O-antigen/teichoic acid export membrane protein
MAPIVDPVAERADVGAAAVEGVRWMALSRLVGEIAGVISLVVLSRLVSPAEFGHAAIALTVAVLAGTLVSESLGGALVQRSDVDRRHRESVTALGLSVGLALTIVTLVAAPLIVPVFFNDEVVFLVQLAAPMFLISGVSIAGYAELQRRLAFRTLSLLGLATYLLGATCSIVAAAAGLGAAALLMGALVTAGSNAVALVALTRPPLPRWHARALRETTSFGVPAAFSSLLISLRSQVDYLILGTGFTAAQLGYYYRAFTLGVDYQAKVSGVIMHISFPIYSRAREQIDVRALRRRIMCVQTAILLPVLGLFIAVAPVLVPWALGERWTPAVVPAQIMAVAGMANAVKFGTGPLVLAMGRPRALLTLNTVALALYIPMLLALVPHGVTTVAIGNAAFFVAQALASYYFLLDRLLGIPMKALVTDVAAGATSAAGVVVAAGLVVAGLERVGWAAIPTMVAAGITAVVVHEVVLRSVFRPVWADLWLLIGRVVPMRSFIRQPAA